MAQELLSTDPKAGDVLSSDPAAGTAPQAGPQIGPAMPGTARPPHSPQTLGESIGYQDPLGPKARAFITTPLAHPTGIDAVDAMTSPANLTAALVSGGMAAKEAQAAGPLVSRTLAAGKGIIASAAPVVKYELARSGLRTAGIPDSIAIPAAMLLSGYQRGGVKSAAAPQAETVAPASAPVDLSAATAEATAARAARFGSQRGWATQLAQNPDGWKNVSTAVARDMPGGISPDEVQQVQELLGKEATAPPSWAELLKPPPPASLAKAQGLVKAGKSVVDAARQVAGSNTTLSAQIVTALNAAKK